MGKYDEKNPAILDTKEKLTSCLADIDYFYQRVREIRSEHTQMLEKIKEILDALHREDYDDLNKRCQEANSLIKEIQGEAQ